MNLVSLFGSAGFVVVDVGTIFVLIVARKTVVRMDVGKWLCNVGWATNANERAHSEWGVELSCAA